MLWLLLLLDRAKLRRPYTGSRVVRQVAEATFSLYLFHMPLLMLIAAFVPYDRGSSVQKIAVLAVVLLASVAIDIPLARLKGVLRSTLSSWVAQPTPRSRVDEGVTV